MRYVAISLFLLVTAGIAALAYVNLLNEAPFSLLFWQLPEVSVGIVCLLTFLLGALMLYVVSLVAGQRETGELRKLRKRVAELEQGARQEVGGTLPVDAPVVAIVPMPGMSGRDISDIPTQH